MNFSSLYKFFEQEPAFRKKQMEKAVFCDCIEDWDEATVFSKAMREKLKAECSLEIPVLQVETAGKNAEKALFNFDGARIEAVLMRHKSSVKSPESKLDDDSEGEEKQGRNTVCVSSQAGCSLHCRFCATGQGGFSRDLNAWEIVQQVLYFKRRLRRDLPSAPPACPAGRLQKGEVTNIVFMGMGEPFLNYDAVLRAVRIFNDPEKFNIGARRISISTVGVVPGIRKLAKEEEQVNLAVSLHAHNDELRSALMPINEKYPLRRLLEAILEYIELTNRRVMIEYILLQGVNDSAKDARELAKLLKQGLGRLFVVNLIGYNQTGEFFGTSQEAAEKFKKILEQEGVAAVQRYRFGENIKAACGQLSAKHEARGHG